MRPRLQRCNNAPVMLCDDATVGCLRQDLNDALDQTSHKWSQVLLAKKLAALGYILRTTASSAEVRVRGCVRVCVCARFCVCPACAWPDQWVLWVLYGP